MMRTALVDWKEAQQKAGLTAPWAVTMAKVRIQQGCFADTLAARHVLREVWW
jgi:hypothetical protein